METEEEVCWEDNNAGNSSERTHDSHDMDKNLDLLQPSTTGKTVNGTMGGGEGGGGTVRGGLKESILNICRGVMAGTDDSVCRLLIRSGAVLFRNTRSRGMCLGALCLLTLSCMLMASKLLSQTNMNLDLGIANGEDQFARKLRRLKVEVIRNVRNTTINSLCAVEELNHISMLNSEQRKTLDAQVLVDDAHKFIYCFVPKVACSNWKRVIKYMNNKVPDLETPMKMDHHKDLVFLSDFSEQEVEYRLKNYFKFMFVRDPTERLLSAYRNKFGENIGSYNTKYGPKIIAKYRKPGVMIDGTDQSKITFEEFLRFLVDSDTRRMDPHWRPMHELCQPCVMKYDFIGSFEQLSEDANFVINKVRGSSDAYFPARQSWYKPTTDDKKERELRNVHTAYMKQVVDKYARDYMLFGYPPPVSEVTRPKSL